MPTETLRTDTWFPRGLVLGGEGESREMFEMELTAVVFVLVGDAWELVTVRLFLHGAYLPEVYRIRSGSLSSGSPSVHEHPPRGAPCHPLSPHPQ